MHVEGVREKANFKRKGIENAALLLDDAKSTAAAQPNHTKSCSRGALVSAQ